MIEEGLFSLLTGAAGVAALVGARVYPLSLPQNPTLPAVLYTRTSTSRDLHQGGGIKAAESWFAINCFATSIKVAKQISAAIRGALHGYKGAAGSETIMRGKIQNEFDLFDEDLGVYQVRLDAVITHKEN